MARRPVGPSRAGPAHPPERRLARPLAPTRPRPDAETTAAHADAATRTHRLLAVRGGAFAPHRLACARHPDRASRPVRTDGPGDLQTRNCSADSRLRRWLQLPLREALRLASQSPVQLGSQPQLQLTARCPAAAGDAAAWCRSGEGTMLCRVPGPADDVEREAARRGGERAQPWPGAEVSGQLTVSSCPRAPAAPAWRLQRRREPRTWATYLLLQRTPLGCCAGSRAGQPRGGPRAGRSRAPTRDRALPGSLKKAKLFLRFPSRTWRRPSPLRQPDRGPFYSTDIPPRLSCRRAPGCLYDLARGQPSGFVAARPRKCRIEHVQVQRQVDLPAVARALPF